MVSFKNHAIELPGKCMKPRHIPAKVLQCDDRVPISAISTLAVRGTLIHRSDGGCTCVSVINTCTIMWNSLKLKKSPKHPML